MVSISPSLPPPPPRRRHPPRSLPPPPPPPPLPLDDESPPPNRRLCLCVCLYFTNSFGICCMRKASSYL